MRIASYMPMLLNKGHTIKIDDIILQPVQIQLDYLQTQIYIFPIYLFRSTGATQTRLLPRRQASSISRLPTGSSAYPHSALLCIPCDTIFLHSSVFLPCLGRIHGSISETEPGKLSRSHVRRPDALGWSYLSSCRRAIGRKNHSFSYQASSQSWYPSDANSLQDRVCTIEFPLLFHSSLISLAEVH